MKTLQEIFDKHDCDKGSKRHRYDRIYEPLFESLQQKDIKIFEIGILRGKSIESYLEYFPNAVIYAIDIFTRVPIEDIPILNHERVKWCTCDSTIEPKLDFKQLVGRRKFDIIIDDGLHFPNAQRRTFNNFMPYLKKNGVYFIEDVWPISQMSEEQKKHPWLIKHNHKYSDRKYNMLLESLNSYDATFHDLRKGFHPDTFIIEVKNKR